MQDVEKLLASGRPADAFARAATLETTSDLVVLHRIGQLYTATNRHEDAGRVFRRAVALAPNNATCLSNLASSEIALGRIESAEALFDHVLTIDPHDYDAYYNRATLRRQTAASNHVAQMERMMAGPLRHPTGEVALGYALGKELEDLGEYARSFAWLKRGADARRRLLSYAVAGDVETMEAIAHAFDAAVCARSGGYAGARPIFILGLPRSGTTLVDRILSSHSLVESHGETTAFAQNLVRLAGPASGKLDLVRRSTVMDHAALGQAYAESVGAGATVHLIDKTPANFLYIGLIALALPNAHIVHVRRDPMDVCYAMYKTLFRMAYPFSYDLGDLARYHAAYARLMQHWHAVLPGRIHDLSYEALIHDQEGVTRALLSHCDLAFEPACLAFEKNAAPSLTASAAQVREPLYASSIGLWRRYESELAPLARMLRDAGIAFA